MDQKDVNSLLEKWGQVVPVAPDREALAKMASELSEYVQANTGDRERIHRRADRFLLDALVVLGHGDLARVWQNLENATGGFWYA